MILVDVLLSKDPDPIIFWIKIRNTATKESCSTCGFKIPWKP